MEENSVLKNEKVIIPTYENAEITVYVQVLHTNVAKGYKWEKYTTKLIGYIYDSTREEVKTYPVVLDVSNGHKINEELEKCEVPYYIYSKSTYFFNKTSKTYANIQSLMVDVDLYLYS